MLARVDARRRTEIVLSLQRNAGNAAVSALMTPRQLAREIRGDVTQVSIDPSFAQALTDDELAGQVALLRARLTAGADPSLAANLTVLEDEVRRRDSATQPAPAAVPGVRALPAGLPPPGCRPGAEATSPALADRRALYASHSNPARMPAGYEMAGLAPARARLLARM
jgi:hypothetical protein